MDRSRFLAAAGGAALAGTILPLAAPLRASAQSAGIIDVHHHALPPFYFQAAAGPLQAQTQGRAPAAVGTWTPEQSLAAMHEQGIATAILSISTPGVWFGDNAAARELARRCNVYMAGVVRANPQRFGVFAALPLPDVDGALAEIAYALDELKADGVGIMTSYENRWLGDPAFNPVWEELNRRQAVVYVHPTAPGCCRNIQPGIVAPMVEFVFDTTRTIVSLLYSGALVRYPNIKFIFSHSGGTLPMIAGRIDDVGRQTRPDFAAVIPQGNVEAAISRLYFDIANSMYAPSYAALRASIPLSQYRLRFGLPVSTDRRYAPRHGSSRQRARSSGNRTAQCVAFAPALRNDGVASLANRALHRRPLACRGRR